MCTARNLSVFDVKGLSVYAVFTHAPAHNSRLFARAIRADISSQRCPHALVPHKWEVFFQGVDFLPSLMSDGICQLRRVVFVVRIVYPLPKILHM